MTGCASLSPMTYADFEPQPVENVQRGTIVTLLVIPIGIIVWVLLWNVGFVASVVAWGVAWLALRLYRWGSGGFVTRTGAIRITVITVVTLVLALIAGLAGGQITAYASYASQPVVATALDPQFWGLFWPAFPSIVAANGLSIVIALAFGALGCFNTLRSAFRATAPVPPRQQTMPESFYPRDRDETPEK